MQDEFEFQREVPGFVVRGGERRPTTLRMSEEGVASTDEPAGIVPWRSARLRRDDSDQAILVVGKRVVLGSADPKFLRTVESVAGNDVDRELARLTGQRVGWKGSQAIGCLLFFGLFAYGIASIPRWYNAALDRTVASLEPSIDEQLGEAALEAMGEMDVIEIEVVDEAIQEIVDRLIPHMGDQGLDAEAINWQIRVVNDETVNAFALPGGSITVFTGLIETATSPDMVAGVIAHEMAHVTMRHGLKRVANKVGLFAGLSILFGDVSGLVGVAAEALNLALDNGYSQDLETEADLIGTKAMARAGLDAKELGSFFQILKETYGDVPPMLAWMGTHPGHSTRTEAIEAILAEMEGELPAPEPLEVDWEAVKAALSSDE